MRKLWQFGIGGLAIAWVAALALAQGGDEAESRKVKSSDSKKLEPIVVENCKLTLIDSVTLSSQRPGVLAFVEPREGDEVAANSHIAALIDDVAQASYQAAKVLAENEVQIEYAKSAADYAELEYRKGLEANRRSKGGIPVHPEIDILRFKLAWVKAKLEVKQAEFQKEVDRSKRDEAYEMLNTYQIHAPPFDGVVVKVFKLPGEGVREGDSILEIVSTKRVQVDGTVHLKDVWNIHKGDRVELRITIPDADLDIEDEVFEGKIRFVDPRVSPLSSDHRVLADVINRDDMLREGFDATMTIFPSRSGHLTAGSGKNAASTVSSKSRVNP